MDQHNIIIVHAGCVVQWQRIPDLLWLHGLALVLLLATCVTQGKIFNIFDPQLSTSEKKKSLTSSDDCETEQIKAHNTFLQIAALAIHRVVIGFMYNNVLKIPRWQTQTIFINFADKEASAQR